MNPNEALDLGRLLQLRSYSRIGKQSKAKRNETKRMMLKRKLPKEVNKKRQVETLRTRPLEGEDAPQPIDESPWRDGRTESR